jgi:hypothetical protein
VLGFRGGRKRIDESRELLPQRVAQRRHRRLEAAIDCTLAQL